MKNIFNDKKLIDFGLIVQNDQKQLAFSSMQLDLDEIMNKNERFHLSQKI
jgi:hypothetical protein